MKSVFLEAPRKIKVREYTQREPGPGEALIKIVSAGICGSDIGAYRGTNGLVSYPRTIGHELAGTVVTLPADYTGELKPGDRVVADPYLYCGHCYPCSLGRTNCCESLKVLGVQTEGGMAETFCHPADMLIKAPDGIPWDILSMAEPLTIALHGIHRLGLKKGEHIAISGAGTIGLLAALTAISYGAEPILIDPVVARLDFAGSLGVKHLIDPSDGKLTEKIREMTGGRMAECVMEASGAGSAIRSTLDIVSYAGRIALTGWPSKETLLPTDIITRKELDIKGARTSAGEFAEAIRLIESGEVNVRALLTKTVTPDEAPAVIEDIEKNPQNYLKVVVMF